MPAPYTGGCLCGSLRYRLTEEPLTAYVCHCTDCQRRTGSAFAISVIVNRSALQLDQGTTANYRAELPDGRVKAGVFCPLCATRLWGEPVKAPQIGVLQPGTLDDPSWLRPVAHLWTRSKQPWLTLPDDQAVRFETQPEDRLHVFRLWRDRHHGG